MINGDSSSLLVLMVVASDGLVNTVLYSYPSSGNDRELKILAVGEAQQWQSGEEGEFEQSVNRSWQTCLQKTSVSKEKIFKLIFMVSPFWTINSEKIIDSKKELLTKVCKNFSLKPSGFIVDDEAMIHYFGSEQESLPSFIVVFSGKKEFRISLVHLGKIKGRVKLDIEGGLSADQVKDGLAQLDFDGVMPPLIYFWGEIDESLEEELSDYSWTEEGEDLFLHLPEVTVFSWQKIAEVYSRIIGSRLNETNNVLEKDSFLKTEDEDEKETEEKARPEDWQGSSFGFSQEDISSYQAKDDLSKPLDEFLENKDQNFLDEAREKDNFAVSVPVNKEPGSGVKFTFSGFRKIRLPRVGFKFGGVKKKMAIFLLLILVFFAGLVVFAKTTIDIYVTPQQIKSSFQVNLSSEGVLSVDQKILPAQEIFAEKEDRGSVVASGTKLIGEKATGKVIIYNRTDSQAVFEEGTVISSLAGLDYVLDKEVKIASKTADLVSGVDRWGEVEVSVTATDIGSDYNLAKDTSFVIDGFSESDYLAKNEQQFSGGTSREILAVSEEDYNSLKEKLISKLETEIKSELLDKINNDSLMIEETLTLDTVSFSVDNQIGDESDSLEGSLKVKASVLTISKEDLRSFAEQVLRREVDSGMRIDSDSFSFNFSPQQKGDDWAGDFHIEAKAYPNIDTEGLKEAIKGKTKKIAKENLRVFPRVYRFQIGARPSFMKFWPLISFFPDNILVSIED